MIPSTEYGTEASNFQLPNIKFITMDPTHFNYRQTVESKYIYIYYIYVNMNK